MKVLKIFIILFLVTSFSELKSDEANDILKNKILKNIRCLICQGQSVYDSESEFASSIKLIGLNYRDNFNNAKKFIDNFGNPYSIILIDKDGTLGVEFGAYGVPETFLIDKNKDIIKKFVGPINQEIVNKIKLIIK